MKETPYWFAFYMQFKDKWSREVHDEDGIKAIESRF